MAIEHVLPGNDGKIQGLGFKNEDGKEITVYVAEPGKYNLGKASGRRKIAGRYGGLVINQEYYMSGTSRTILIEPDQKLEVEVPRATSVFAVLDL